MLLTLCLSFIVGGMAVFGKNNLEHGRENTLQNDNQVGDIIKMNKDLTT